MKVKNVVYRREFLEKLPTDELDEMLQKELKKESIDDDLVRVVLSVLEEREINWPAELNDEIAADVERFENSINIQYGVKVRPNWHWTLKAASILLVVGLLLFVAPQAVRAENFFEMLARWTDSIFEFFDPRENNEKSEYMFETDNAGLQQVYDTVVEIGIADPVVPMWIPEGFVLQDISTIKQSLDTTVLATLTKNEEYILLNVMMHNQEVSFRHEKNAENVRIIEFAGVQHYVLSNLNEYIVTWVLNGVECSLVTNCQEEDLHYLLESIYKMEE